MDLSRSTFRYGHIQYIKDTLKIRRTSNYSEMEELYGVEVISRRVYKFIHRFTTKDKKTDKDLVFLNCYKHCLENFEGTFN